MRRLEILLALLPLLSPAVSATMRIQVAGDTVTLAWDPNTEEDPAGYRVYRGPAPGTYTWDPKPTVGVSPAPSYTFTGVAPGTWYFAVTAFNTSGLESGYSNEVSTTIEPLPPAFQITSMAASLRWFGVVCLATSSEKAGAIFRYRKLEDGTKWSTVIATPGPTKTEHRVVLYFPAGASAYAYEWTVTSASGVVITGAGTFQTR